MKIEFPLFKNKLSFNNVQNIIAGKKIKRMKPINFEDLEDRWKSFFQKVDTDFSPNIFIKNYYDPVFNLDAVVWQHGEVDISFHEFSERRMLSQKYYSLSFLNVFRRPKSTIKKIISRIFKKDNIQFIHTDKTVLIFWDSRCFVNKYQLFIFINN